jgi:hypothetical protein
MSQDLHRTLCCLLLLSLISVTSCQQQRNEQQQPYLARVDNVMLTPEYLNSQIDTSILHSDYQIREYVTRWVNTELLYKEAQRRGFDANEKITQTLQNTKRELAINMLLEEEIYPEEKIRIEESEIDQHYLTHQQDFVLTNDVVNINYVIFTRQSVADDFRARVVSATWRETIDAAIADAKIAKYILARGDSSCFKQSDMYPPDLWKTVATLGINAVSFPVRTVRGYYVMMLNGVERAGRIASRTCAAAEIRERLRIEKRQMLLENLVSDLKKKYKVEINLSYYGIKDTVKAQPE